MIIELEEAKDILDGGGNVIIPTETVYGLAASIESENGIGGIFRLKNRPKENPLIIHCANLNQVLNLVKDVPASFYLLAEKFWPGSLTMILLGKENLNTLITAGLKTVAVRIPRHSEALKLIDKTGPLVAPSANLSGKPSSTKIKHLETDFGAEFPVLKGEEPEGGVESTIIGWIKGEWVLLRYGFIPREKIEEVLGLSLNDSNLQICPGTQFRHYSPEAKIFCGERNVSIYDAVIGFDNRFYETAKPFYSLGRDDDPLEIAHNLFAVFRKIDEDGIEKVWIDIDLPTEGLYNTIIERILKASVK